MAKTTLRPAEREEIERLRSVYGRVKSPDIELLMEWEAQGGCEAVCPYHCWVEPDGICPHGGRSWFLFLGLI